NRVIKTLTGGSSTRTAGGTPSTRGRKRKTPCGESLIGTPVPLFHLWHRFRNKDLAGTGPCSTCATCSTPAARRWDIRHLSVEMDYIARTAPQRGPAGFDEK